MKNKQKYVFFNKLQSKMSNQNIYIESDEKITRKTPRKNEYILLKSKNEYYKTNDKEKPLIKNDTHIIINYSKENIKDFQTELNNFKQIKIKSLYYLPFSKFILRWFFKTQTFNITTIQINNDLFILKLDDENNPNLYNKKQHQTKILRMAFNDFVKLPDKLKPFYDIGLSDKKKPFLTIKIRHDKIKIKQISNNITPLQQIFFDEIKKYHNTSIFKIDSDLHCFILSEFIKSINVAELETNFYKNKNTKETTKSQYKIKYENKIELNQVQPNIVSLLSNVVDSTKTKKNICSYINYHGACFYLIKNEETIKVAILKD